MKPFMIKYLLTSISFFFEFIGWAINDTKEVNASPVKSILKNTWSWLIVVKLEIHDIWFNEACIKIKYWKETISKAIPINL